MIYDIINNMRKEPAHYNRKKGKVPERIETNIKTGLTAGDVLERRQMGYDNPESNKKSTSVWGIIFSELFTYFNMIFFVIAIIMISIGAYTQLTFMVVVLANLLIGIIQRLKSKKVVDKLSLVAASKTMVIRDGKQQEIYTTDIVLDDIVILKNGQQIACDGIVKKGELRVNESLLTGESVPVVKKVGDTVLSGSFVVNGEAFVRADKVGQDTFVLKLTSQAKKYKKPNSIILNTLNSIIKVIGIIIIPIAFLLFSRTYGGPASLYQTLTKTAGAILGMIPSGLFLLTSTALVVSVIRLAKQKILVQELYCIEMLARVNMVCMDKTGTITDGSMKLKDLVILRDRISKKDLESIIKSMLYHLDGDNDTSLALKKFFPPEEVYKQKSHFNFSSETKFSCVNLEKIGACFMGAPEMLLDKQKDIEVLKEVQKYASFGYRVMVVCNRKIDYNGKGKAENVTPYGLILLEDNVREDAIQTIKFFNENSVGVKVISGDNPITVAEVASRAGIPGADKYISLEGLTDEEVVKVASEYTIFGRVVPHQKKLLIQALKLGGDTVAMIGDGVNDILALKEADCSIAIGGGADAARRVSQIVLTDSNFCSMQNVVAEGRRVTNNIRVSAPLFLTKTMFSVVFSIFCILFAFVYPFSPVQLILMEYFAIGLSSFALALQPNKDLIKKGFLRNILLKSFIGAFVDLSIAIFLYTTRALTHLSLVEVQSIMIVCITVNSLIVIARVSWPFNLYRATLLTIVTMLVVSGMLFLSNIYGLAVLEGTPFYNLLQIDQLSSRGYAYMYGCLGAIPILLLVALGLEQLINHIINKRRRKIALRDYLQ
ncbi:MAG: HAD-IC family P-type ATPase [Clostridia bacterium]|nr:HAD-IC family P-type ATPase [Clostridia bacterium]